MTALSKALLAVVPVVAAVLSLPVSAAAAAEPAERPVALVSGATSSGESSPGTSTRSVPYQVRRFQPNARTPATLRRHWRVWTARHVTRYRTRVVRGCFCPPQRTRVTVVHGHRVVRVADGPRRPRSRGFEIDRLYRMLQHAYLHADAVDVVWRRGVPVRIGIDPEFLMADEETYYTVRLRDLRRR